MTNINLLESSLNKKKANKNKTNNKTRASKRPKSKTISLKEITILWLKMKKKPNNSLKKTSPSLLLIMFKPLLIGWLSRKDSSNKDNKKLTSRRLFPPTKKDPTLISFLTNNFLAHKNNRRSKQAKNIDNQSISRKRIKWKQAKDKCKINPICLRKNHPYKR